MIGILYDNSTRMAERGPQGEKSPWFFEFDPGTVLKNQLG